jgi:PAS domain S-box-containing protein
MQNEELRKTWVELEESRQKFQDLYDFAPVGYLSMDEKGIIIEANLTLADLLDIKREKLIGKAFILFMDYDSRRKFHKHLNQILETKTKEICELKIKKQGSEEISFDAYMESIPMYDDEGNLKMLRTILTDITERKNAELSVARLAALVKSSEDAIIGVDLDRRIQSWNLGAQKIYGYSAEEILDKDVNKLIPSHCAEAETVILNSVEKSELTKNYNTKRSTKNKGEIDVSLTMSPILDADGKIIGTSSISRDITHVKNTERELEEYRKNLEKQVENRTKQPEIANKKAEKCD